MQIPERLPETQGQRQHESQRTERGSDVVAEKLWIAEDISGSNIVIDVPRRQRKQRNQKRQNAPSRSPRILVPQPSDRTPLVHNETKNFPARQSQGREDRGLLGKSAQRKPNRDRDRTLLQISTQSP